MSIPPVTKLSAPVAAGIQDTYDFEEAFERIQDVTGCCTQLELAQLIGVRQSSISDAAKRKSISSNWLLCLVRRYDLNPDWVLYGAEPKYLHEFSANTPRFDLRSISNDDLLIELRRRLELDWQT